jgi:hypothetical protein
MPCHAVKEHRDTFCLSDYRVPNYWTQHKLLLMGCLTCARPCWSVPSSDVSWSPPSPLSPVRYLSHDSHPLDLRTVHRKIENLRCLSLLLVNYGNDSDCNIVRNNQPDLGNGWSQRCRLTFKIICELVLNALISKLIACSISVFRFLLLLLTVSCGSFSRNRGADRNY